MYKEFLHSGKITQVDKIIHIADVHVRNFKRHDEYKKVFDKVYDYCRTSVLLNPNTIIYLAGDIVHAKTDMSPELISIVTDFLNTLSKIAPTILIAGNHDCYTPDHEVLTKNGWVNIGDYVNSNVDYEVATFDAESRTIKFENPTAKIKKEFIGNLVNIVGKDVDMLVTPAHRVIHHTASNDKLYTKDASDIKSGMYIPINGIVSNRQTNSLAELLGFSFADGTFVTNENGGVKRIQFHLKKERKIQYLSNLLTELNYPFNVNKQKTGNTIINIYSDLAKKIYGFFNGKKELSWDILSEDSNFLDSFIKGYLNGDGSITPNKNFFRYTNISKENIEIISTIIRIIGGVSHTKLEGSNTGGYENSKIQYSANASFSDKMRTTCVKEVNDVEYNGHVYCLSVPSTYLMIRRNGKIFISGNCNLNNFSRMDALTPIVDFIDSDSNDLFYLKETGVYTLQNVDFILNSVYEDPENFILAKDVVSDNIKIVLFHGAVDMASTDMGMTMKNKHITVEKFDGFDYGLFGDIHKFQYLDSKCKFAYAGSLIQQNFGEGLVHGIIEWDLVNKKSKFVRIENEWTYHTVEVDNGVVKKYPTEFSKINSIRLKTNNTSNADIFNIVTELKSKANVVDIRVQRVSNKLTNQQQTTTKLLGDIRDVEQQNDLIVDFIKTRYNVNDETLEDIKNINRKINTRLSESDIVRNLIWQPIEFEFDNMFSYGEGNSINFDDMNGVYGLFAPNATGKSSILDAFMFCIFDKCSRTYKASQIMNNQKETFKCKLTFRLAGNTYVIERTGVKDKKGAVKVNVDFWREDEDGRVVLNGQDRDSTNFIIRKYLGTYDDFIITAMSLQGNNTNFVDKAQRERKDLLAQFLDLDLFEELNGIASDEVKGVQALIKEFSKQDYSTKIADSRNKYKVFSSKLDEIIDEKNSIHKTLEKFSDEIIDLNKSIVDIDSNFKNLSSEDLDSKLEIASNKLVTTNKQIKDLELESKSLNDKYAKTQDKLATIDKETITKKRDEMDKLKIILSDYESDLRSIRLKINHCESKIDNLKTHEYDPNCKYCTNNVFVQDAMKAENSLVDLVNDEKELIGKINELESTLNKNSDVYTELNRLHHFENELFGIQKEIYKIEKELYAKKETAVESKNIINKTNEMIKRYKDNKDAIVNNEKVRSKIKEIEGKKYQLSNYKLRELEDEIIECSGKVKVHEKIISECAESIDKLKELEKEFYAYDYYLKAVNRNGVPYQLISDALPKIQAETNNILSQIVDFQVLFDTDGKSINTYIVYDDENFWALELSSGMEKFISSLAIRTALISISSLPRPNFIVIDEGLGALDPTVLNNFALFLDYLKTQFDFAILISHIDIVRDIVDSQIDIKKENGYSAINF